MTLVLTCSPAFAAEWQPKQAPLMTKWAKDVTPQSVHAEYPRPQMVREHWQNLNGLWEYAIRPMDAVKPDKWDGEILVPFPVESALSGVMKMVGPENRLWYRRTFTLPKQDGQTSPAWRDKNILLRFGAVDWETTVWLNGKEVGTHKGGYDPFTFDITAALKPDDTQELVVSVWDPSDAGFQPRGKQVRKPEGIWYTPITGIWQTVWLEPVPKTYIRGVTITPDLDNRQFAIQVDVVNPKPGWKVGVLFNSQPKSGGVVHRSWHANLNQPIIVDLGRELESRILDHLWSPHNPHLIDIHVALVPDPKADLLGFGQEWMPNLSGPGAPEKRPPVAMADWVKTYSALRKISLGKDEKGVTRLMLNNKPVFQHGPLDQGFWPDGLYTAPTDEALKFDIAITRQYGFNMIRKHVKVEPARWYYHCDGLGMLVWQDMPSGDKHAQWDPFGKHDNTETTRSQESSDNFNREWKAIIDSLRNHPCIVMWVPFNEGWGQANTVAVTKWTKEYDPTRLVNCASGGNDFPVGDVIDVHRYPGPFAPQPTIDRAAVLGEYGGLGLPLKGHTWQNEKNWSYRSFTDQAEMELVYLDLLDRLILLKQDAGLSASIYTQTTDVEIEVNGLMTYDREVMKLPVRTGVVEHQYLTNVANYPHFRRDVIPTSQREGQEWRYTFEKPSDAWAKSDFDDSTWKKGLGGFGEKTTPGSVVRTEWKTNDIWMRRTVEFDPELGELRMLMHHDEDGEVYFNGELARSVTGFTTDYQLFRLSKKATWTYAEGSGIILQSRPKLTIAVHCKQTGGGQYIDVGFQLWPARK